MDTFKIHATLAAVKHKSLSKAAEEFSYTPSAFSHIAAALEEELGVTLLKRSSTGVEWTPEGEQLRPLLEAMVRDEAALKKAAALLSGGKTKELRIGIYSSMSRNFLADILKKLKSEHPDVKPSVCVADDLHGWLENDRADVIFADQKTLSEANWFPLLEDQYCAVLPHNRFPGNTHVTLEALYPFTYIDTDDAYLNEYLDMERFAERISFRSEDDLSVINMVKDGIGITILPKLVLNKNTDGVKVLPLEPKLIRTLGFAYHKKRISAIGLTGFLKSLQTIHKRR